MQAIVTNNAAPTRHIVVGSRLVTLKFYKLLSKRPTNNCLLRHLSFAKIILKQPLPLRCSELALCQTNIVISKLTKLNPEISFSIIKMKTKGMTLAVCGGEVTMPACHVSKIYIILKSVSRANAHCCSHAVRNHFI